MTQKEILSECAKNGVDCSFMTVYRIGLKEGFYGGESGCFDERKFKEWLGKISIPKDCMFVSDAVKKYGVAYNVFKHYFSVHNIELKSGGWKKGGMKYARKSDIERVVEKHNGRSVAKRRKEDD